MFGDDHVDFFHQPDGFRVTGDPGEQALKQPPARALERLGGALEALEKKGADERDDLLLAALVPLRRLVGGFVAFPVGERVVGEPSQERFRHAPSRGRASSAVLFGPKFPRFREGQQPKLREIDFSLLVLGGE